jgi:hypothetical protein
MDSDDLVPDRFSSKRRRLTGTQVLVVVIMASVVPAIMAWRAVGFFGEMEGRDKEGMILRVRAESTEVLEVTSVRESGELLLYEFGSGLREARIYDIVVDGDRLWIGTGKGLVEFADGGEVRLHRQFSGAPFEWTQDLALHDGWLAVDVLVAEGNSGGHYAGSHVLDTRTGEWHELGANVLDQVWLGDALWQRPLARMLVRQEFLDGVWRSKDVSLSSRLCSHAQMAAIDGSIWMAQQGVVHFTGGARVRGGSYTKEVPCGVLRFEPETGSETLFEERHGLNSGFGRDVAGDARQVWVGHSIKHGKLSVYDRQTGKWGSAPPCGSANTVALGEDAAWLATPSGSAPLLRIDRETRRCRPVTGVPQGYYVSAIAIDGDAVWLGLYRQNWQGSSFTIDSYLARYREGGRDG